MSLTYGFYNSLNGDRRYDAMQMSAIFDGIINDGIFMSEGNQMIVSAAGGMNLNVGTGRAWFNHTWTLNDSTYALEVSTADILLPRIDAVVLEINNEQAVRANSFKIITGTAASNPSAPDLVETEFIHQHKLAEIRVNANVTVINQADITNFVGTTDTPFVTGILETMDITALVAQWKSEWEQWKILYQEKENTWFDATTRRFENQFTSWASNYVAIMNEFQQTNITEFSNWMDQMRASYEEFVNDSTAEITEFKNTIETETTAFKNQYENDFITWLDSVKEKWSTTIPKATPTVEGVVKPDNKTTFVNDGTISAIPVDDFLSLTSTNSVQNSVITNVLVTLMDGFAKGEIRTFIVDANNDLLSDRDGNPIFGGVKIN